MLGRGRDGEGFQAERQTLSLEEAATPSELPFAMSNTAATEPHQAGTRRLREPELE